MSTNSVNLLLFPNPGDIGRYETKLAEEFDLLVYQSYSEGGTRTRLSVNEFGSKPIGPVKGIRDRLDYSFYSPPKKPEAIISTGHIGKEITPHLDQIHFHLTHGLHRGSFGLPPREAFSDNFLKSTLEKINRSWLRTREERLLASIDVHVVNSQFTADVLEHYYDITVDEIINPPVDTRVYYNDRPVDSEFYFYVGRLERIKRVTEIVEAFNKLDKRLLVAGSGSKEKHLRDISNDNIDILGCISEEEKRQKLARCNGFIQNSIAEDFGITTVEALASGAPIIAVRDGNNPNLVTEGENGILYSGDDASRPFQTSSRIEELREAIEKAEMISWDHTSIQKTAEPYDISYCMNSWSDLLQSFLANK
jgi:glycosyltransferase involved in cell wall biosynthesis